MNPTTLKYGLVALLNVGAFVLVALDKIDWPTAKDVLIYTMGPLLVGHSVEVAATNLGVQRAVASSTTKPKTNWETEAPTNKDRKIVDEEKEKKL